MNVKVKNVKVSAKDREIDEFVEKQVPDADAWENPVKVAPRLQSTSIRLSGYTIERAKQLAKIHGDRGYQTWLKKIIEERIGFEAAILRRLKNEVA